MSHCQDLVVSGNRAPEGSLSDRDPFAAHLDCPTHQVCRLDHIPYDTTGWVVGPPRKTADPPVQNGHRLPRYATNSFADTVAHVFRSSGDETEEKLPFYANLGVPELWIIDRDTKRLELLTLEGATYILQSSDADGWLASQATSVRFRTEGTQRLAVLMEGDPKSRRLLPDE